MADPFDPTTPTGNQSAGGADEELRAIKQVLSNWKVFNQGDPDTLPDPTLSGPVRLAAVETQSAATTALAATLNISNQILQDNGTSNALHVDIEDVTDDDLPNILFVKCTGTNDGITTPTLQINSGAAINIQLNGGGNPPASSMVPGWIAELWKDPSLNLYVLSNPRLSAQIQNEVVFLYTDGAEHSWTVPSGVTSVTYEAQAPGGRGGSNTAGSGGGGGGAGAFMTGTIAVTPGDTILYTVAAPNETTGNPAGITLKYLTNTWVATSGARANSTTPGTGTSAGGVGGTTSGTTTATNGQSGAAGSPQIVGVGAGGKGGNSVLGTGGTTNANPGNGYGAGGGGRQYEGGGGVGGAGAPGILKFKFVTP